MEREAKTGECPRAPLGHTSVSRQRPYPPERSSTATPKYGATPRWLYSLSLGILRILPGRIEIHKRHHIRRRRHRHTAQKIAAKIKNDTSRQRRASVVRSPAPFDEEPCTSSRIQETVGHFGLQHPLRVNRQFLGASNSTNINHIKIKTMRVFIFHFLNLSPKLFVPCEVISSCFSAKSFEMCYISQQPH